MPLSLSCGGNCRFVIIGWAFLECALFAGIFYGWSSIVFVLKEEGVYSELCSTSNQTNSDPDMSLTTRGSINASRDLQERQGPPLSCFAQDSKFNLCFTIGGIAGSIAFLFTMHINYKLGTRLTRILNCVVYTTGLLCMAFVSKETPWLMFVAMPLLLASGESLVLTNVQVCKLVKTGQSTIVSACGGAVDTAVLALVIKVVHQAGFTRRNSYLVIAALHLVMWSISTFAFLPKSFIVDKDEEEEKNKKKPIDTPKPGDIVDDKDTQNGKQESTADMTSTRELTPLPRYLKQPMMLTFIVWFSLCYFYLLYFLGSLNPFLNRVLHNDNEKVSFFTNVGQLIIFVNILMAIVAGTFQDWLQSLYEGGHSLVYRKLMPSVIPFTIPSVMVITSSVLVYIEKEALLYPLFVCVMTLQATLFSVMNSYIVNVYPIEYAGIIFSIVFFFGGVVGSAQHGVFAWNDAYHGAVKHVDIAFMCFGAISLCHPVYIWWNAFTNERSSAQTSVREKGRCTLDTQSLAKEDIVTHL